ncbi:MAG: 3-deoxy-7-phosphoheptulonate synthase [Treponema sp. CETP13]|nr:MAG: 3-deoxy-7-phosphoheptulonate synthase [Treponema sp. CETP13]
MIIVLEKNIQKADKENLKKFLQSNNFNVNEIDGEEETVLGAVGHLAMDPRKVEIMPGVSRVIPISKPYKMASREFKRDNSIVQIPNNRGQIIRIGGMRLASIAGPCAVESEQQMMDVAKAVSSAGAVMLRGGAYKPRTSPYSFQGLGEEGVILLKKAGDKYGLPVVTEIVASEYLPIMIKHGVDCLQVGARNMQNFEMLKKIGATGKPVILKRGLAATIEEWLMAAEYLLSSGSKDVILCERGIRTYEKATRNTLDLSAIPVVKSLTHLPVIVDPSHAVGIRSKVPPMALAAVAAGADGIIVEVHCNPDKALSDGAQSLFPEQFDKLLRDIDVLAPVVNKETTRIRGAVVNLNTAAKNVKDGSQPTQTKVSCAYSGSRGAYAEQAIMHYFDGEAESKPCANFREVFQAVNNGESDCGMVPIENSLAGSVYENYDNLVRFEDISIVGSIKLRIEHSLLSNEGSSIDTIKTVYSHPQGFAQCSDFLALHPTWKQVECLSTTAAAKMVATKGSSDVAAIASVQACNSSENCKKLNVLKCGIESDPRNYTRFLLISSVTQNSSVNSVESKLIQLLQPSNGIKMASFAFIAGNHSGALHESLGVFTDLDLNLTRLESRPIQGQPWRYMFYADVELRRNGKNFDESETATLLQAAKEQLNKTTEEVHLLGVYIEIN